MKLNRKGFTLVEIMIVVAIIALLAVIAVPNLIKARQTTQTNDCKNNMRMISDAIDQWALANNKSGGDTPTLDDDEKTGLTPYLKGNRAPVCKGGGTYTIPSVDASDTVSCSTHGTLISGS